MIHEKSNEGKSSSAEWRRFRQRARETAYSPEEFSAIERTEYNLDSDDRLSPAGVTGQDNPDSYDGSDAVSITSEPEVPLEDDPTR